MALSVNIADAKARLSELVAASLRGEEVILQRAGKPQVRLTPVAAARDEERNRIAAKRRAAFGKYAKEFEGFDTSIEAFQNLYSDPDQDYERKFGSAS